MKKGVSLDWQRVRIREEIIQEVEESKYFRLLSKFKSERGLSCAGLKEWEEI